MSEEIKEPSIERFWHQLYIEKEADPTSRQSDVDFCKEHALDYSTLRAWKTKYRNYIYREVEAKRKNYKNEMRTLIYKSLVKKLDSDTNAIKLLAQLLGDLVEKSEVKTESVSDGDKIRRIKALSEANSKKLAQWERAEKADSSITPKGDGPDAPKPSGADQKSVD